MAVSISGTPVEINNAANSGSQSVTVPAGATGVFVCVGGYKAVAHYYSLGAVTLGGTALTAYAVTQDASTGFHMGAVFFLEGSLTSGSQTLAWDWSGTTAPDDGTLIVVGFVTGSATSSAIRTSIGVQTNTPYQPSGSVTPTSGDFLLAFTEAFITGTTTWTWTAPLTKFADYSLAGYRSTSASLATATSAGASISPQSAASAGQDGSLGLIAIIPGSGGSTKSIAPASITGTSTMSSTVQAKKNLTPATIAATSTMSSTVIAQKHLIPASITATSTMSSSIRKLAAVTPASITGTSTMSSTITKLGTDSILPAAITATSTMSAALQFKRALGAALISGISTLGGTVTGGSGAAHRHLAPSLVLTIAPAIAPVVGGRQAT